MTTGRAYPVTAQPRSKCSMGIIPSATATVTHSVPAFLTISSSLFTEGKWRVDLALCYALVADRPNINNFEIERLWHLIAIIAISVTAAGCVLENITYC